MNATFNTTEPIIEIKDLKKSYRDNHVLKGFNVSLYERENLVIMGKSGSGKSVMIKCLFGLGEPDSISIMFMGKKVCELKHWKLDELRTKIGFLFQGSALYDSMSVRENLEFPLRRHSKKFGVIKDATVLITEALENVGLADAIDLVPSKLSGGMKRRIALARTLILRPKIILCDEPPSGLDSITSKEIILLMMSFQKKYNTSSISIKNDFDCARVISNRMILIIDNNQLCRRNFCRTFWLRRPKN